MARSHLKSSAFFASLFMAAFSAPAMQPLITDDADTQGSGSHQVEVSYSQDRTRWAGKTERVDSVPLAYTYGLTDTLDIFAMTDYSRIRVPGERTSGFCNTVIGLKWRFFENETSGTHLAIKPEVRLPVDSRREEKGLGTGKTSGVLTLILSQKLPFGAVHFNAGMGRDRFRYRHSIDNARNRHFSVAPVWEVSSQWTLAADIGVDLSRSNGDTVRSRFSEIAAIYSPGKNLDLAVGYIRKVGSEYSKTTTHNIIAGVTWRFPQRKISLD